MKEQMPVRWDGTPVPGAWTEEEVRSLRAQAGYFPAATIALHLNRTRSAVLRKAQRQGISLMLRTIDRAAAGQRWTPDDIAHLRRLARTHTVAEVAAVLGRGYHAVVRKARLERISFRKSGLLAPGTRHGAETIRRIWALRQRGWGPQQISGETGIPYAAVDAIIYYRSRYGEMMALDAAGEGSAHD